MDTLYSIEMVGSGQHRIFIIHGDHPSLVTEHVSFSNSSGSRPRSQLSSALREMIDYAFSSSTITSIELTANSVKVTLKDEDQWDSPQVYHEIHHYIKQHLGSKSYE